MSGYRDLVQAALERIDEIDPARLEATAGSVTIIDIRERDEHEQGAIPGSRLIPRGILERDIAGLIPDTATPLVLYCAAGQRSALAALTLLEMGYSNVASLSGGFERWKA